MSFLLKYARSTERLCQKLNGDENVDDLGCVLGPGPTYLLEKEKAHKSGIEKLGLTKKKMDDAAIYTHLAYEDRERIPVRCAHNKLMVVGGGGEIRSFYIPDFGCQLFPESGVSVSKSRLFIIGGYGYGLCPDSSYDTGYNGILSVNFGPKTDSALWETGKGPNTGYNDDDDEEIYCSRPGTALYEILSGINFDDDEKFGDEDELYSFTGRTSRSKILSKIRSKIRSSIRPNSASPSWEMKELGDVAKDFSFIGGTALSNDGELIYGIKYGGNLFAINTKTRDLEFVTPLPLTDCHGLAFLLAVTDTRVYVNYIFPNLKNSLFGFYDIQSMNWRTINDKANLCFLRNKVVVVGDSEYLIDFALTHPITKNFLPALYVYDIKANQWLDYPVQGLDNDDIQLPSSSDPDDIAFFSYLSLMKVRTDPLKLAFVWIHERSHRNYDFHLSKFTLTIQENAGQKPTFKALNLSSSAPFSIEDKRLLRCTSMAVYN